MMLCDYHAHTLFCDGKSSPEEMVLQAIELGVSELGLSGHGYTAHDESYCMLPVDIADYYREVRRLSVIYSDRIKVRCGVEQDFYGEEAPWADYRVGSVHYMKIEDEYVDVDGGNEGLIDAAKKYFGGDMMSVCEVYFDHVGRVAEKLSPDIIGHFDLITKYNERERIIDTENPRYISAWQAAADRLIPYGIPFEINLGAIFRGCRELPYPSEEQIKYIAAHGGKFIMSSDCHDKSDICRDFGKWRAWAEKLGAEILEKI